MLIIGPTDDGKPSRAIIEATRYATRMRREGYRIQVLNPGYRINDREGLEITENAANRYRSYYRGLSKVVQPTTRAILRGKMSKKHIQSSLIVLFFLIMFFMVESLTRFHRRRFELWKNIPTRKKISIWFACYKKMCYLEGEVLNSTNNTI